MYVKIFFFYLDIRKSKKLYLIYYNFDNLNRKHARDFLFCPEIHPLHTRNLGPICYVSLLQDPKEILINCDIMYFQIGKPVLY